MSKYILINDLHFTGRNSKYRLGNYKEDLLLKFDEILEIALKNAVDVLIFTGDLTETESPTYSVIDALIDRVERKKVLTYHLLGNHCLLNGSIENSEGTALYHAIKRSSYFKYLTEINEKDHIINGIEYSIGVEQGLSEKGIYFSDENKWKIAITHCMITPKPFFKEVAHVVCKDIKTNADIVICSHYHHPFKSKANNTEFINAGCVGRLNIDEHDIEPSVLLLDTEKRSYKIIKLKSAKAGSEIFDLTKYNELKDDKKSLSEFITSLNTVNFQKMDIVEQISAVCNENDIKDYLIGKTKEIKNGR
jgi:DNA repair exonuclease SbcCD nuclease subunit